MEDTCFWAEGDWSLPKHDNTVPQCTCILGSSVVCSETCVTKQRPERTCGPVFLAPSCCSRAQGLLAKSARATWGFGGLGFKHQAFQLSDWSQNLLRWSYHPDNWRSHHHAPSQHRSSRNAVGSSQAYCVVKWIWHVLLAVRDKAACPKMVIGFFYSFWVFLSAFYVKGEEKSILIIRLWMGVCLVEIFFNAYDEYGCLWWIWMSNTQVVSRML